jgi:hypothetical protein
MHAGIEVLTAITMKSFIFLDVMPCSLVEVYEISEERSVTCQPIVGLRNRALLSANSVNKTSAQAR